MTSIFYPLPSNVLTNVFPLQKNTHDENEIFNIKIGEETFFLEKKVELIRCSMIYIKAVGLIQLKIIKTLTSTAY